MKPTDKIERQTAHCPDDPTMQDATEAYKFSYQKKLPIIPRTSSSPTTSSSSITSDTAPNAGRAPGEAAQKDENACAIGDGTS
mmetsp:Transcript_31851/g.76360  ORF Transcript_31851/g.76360 Transcript_31851/m.76360 type:complete len:83 (-) Transcript_31851:1256-1504(-)